ncbi:polyphosphate kinase 2 [Candidatus Accumulibacter sp. ACC003]|uniref:polyphosphate kinase 2 n=1 Tax=Candidatus Accumulibacter sp. ACC003 TaxID=2823334 RepID=UPI0025C6A0D0|nr:polyphosphate kinase 2 [Candidatus Accumulibacter sp. ACC003]
MSENTPAQEEVVPEGNQAKAEDVTEGKTVAPVAPTATPAKATPKPAAAKASSKAEEAKPAAAKATAKAQETKAAAKPEKAKEQKAAKEKPAESKPEAADKDKNRETESVKSTRKKPLKTKNYEKALSTLQVELVKLQEWIKFKKLKVVVLFEGRDAAGKGGTIKRITESLSPRVTRVAALPAPTDRETGQWYFQRYVQHLPAGGEMVLFDRSWYNRAGVERVMGFCTDEEYREFLRSCPEFERMLVRSGIILIKYWFSVSNEEQERRFQKRIFHPEKQWKLSPMDLQSRARWVEYSRAKDNMFAHTDIKQAPWFVVDGDDKKRARLNVITHLLNMIDYEDLTPEAIVLPPRQEETGYVRPPMSDQTFIPEVY